MTKETNNLKLTTYDAVGDKDELFYNYVENTSGSTLSNMTKIDDFSGEITGSIINLRLNLDSSHNLGSGSGIGFSLSGSVTTIYGNFSSGCGITFDVDTSSSNVSIRTSASRITVNDGGMYKQLWISGWKPTVDSGCDSSTQLYTTGSISASGIFDYSGFSCDTIEYAYANVPAPADYTGGNVYSKFYWTHPSTGSSTDYKVSWGLQGVGLNDGDALGEALGTAVYANDEGGTALDIYISDFTTVITIGGEPTAGELINWRVSRKADDATNDTLPVDAYLIGTMIWYPVG